MSSVIFLTEDACNVSVKSSSVDLIVTSPPYIGISPDRYGGDQKKQINYKSNKMLKLLLKSTKEMERVLKPSGSILINIGNNEDMPYFYISEVLSRTGLKLANPPFIWNYTNKSIPRQKEMFNSQYGFWFHLVKDIEKIYYNPYLAKKYSEAVWELPWNNEGDPVFDKLNKEYFIGDSFNTELAKRFIEMFTKPNATVFDPFGGSGVTAITAYLNGRNGITNDISEDQTIIAKKRLQLEDERLK